MAWRRVGRLLVAALGRKVGMKARKYVAPVLPLVVTPVAIGAALSAGALALFFNIADDIREQDGVWRFDHDGLRLGLSLRNPQRTMLMKTASALARPDVMSGIGLLSLAISFRHPIHRSKGILLAITLAGGGAIIGVIKMNVGRQRPTLVEALATERSFSFPSGHSFISLCFYGILANWWMRTHKHWGERIAIAVCSVGAIGLIGASRVYLGVHYPSDVLAGFAAAVPWLTACLTAYNQYEKKIAQIDAAPHHFRLPGTRRLRLVGKSMKRLTGTTNA